VRVYNIIWFKSAREGRPKARIDVQVLRVQVGAKVGAKGVKARVKLISNLLTKTFKLLHLVLPLEALCFSIFLFRSLLYVGMIFEIQFSKYYG